MDKLYYSYTPFHIDKIVRDGNEQFTKTAKAESPPLLTNLS